MSLNVRTLSRVFLILSVVSLGAVLISTSQPAAAAAACSLPGQINCASDPECAVYGAICGPTVNVCICTPATTHDDGGTTPPVVDGGSSTTGSGTTGFSNGGPPVTGGTHPPSAKSSGCSVARF